MTACCQQSTYAVGTMEGQFCFAQLERTHFSKVFPFCLVFLSQLYRHPIPQPCSQCSHLSSSIRNHINQVCRALGGCEDTEGGANATSLSGSPVRKPEQKQAESLPFSPNQGKELKSWFCVSGKDTWIGKDLCNFMGSLLLLENIFLSLYSKVW